ncbi:MAG: hypothetical protein OXC08_09525 [Thiotrichales bacterium]|nr:hypothetical protein [Thiotrichales bacterium]
MAEYQQDVDEKCSYPEQVKAAKTLFKSRNRKQNRTFAAVRKELADLCSGTRRCMYCEDSVADEVEHFRPKDLYPEVVFAWMNFLYACGPCNGRKSNKFVVIDDTGAFIDVTRPFGAPDVRPAPGNAALIDPRREDPLEFLMLDLRETFEFTPMGDEGTQDYERASHTIEVLGLNDRDYLVKARKTAFENYCALLDKYAWERDPRRRCVVMHAIRANNHPTVWWEMKRQQQRWEELAVLFAHAPDFLDL